MGNNDTEQLFWNRYAGSYDGLGRHYEPYIQLVDSVCAHIDEFAEGRSLSILDAGCGTGIYTARLAEMGHRVIGIDASPSMLARAEQKAVRGRWPHPPKILQHDLTAPLPFDDRSFDAVISVHVLYVLDDHRAFVEELRRVAKAPSLVIVANSCEHLSLQDAVEKQRRMSRGLKRVRAFASLLPVIFWNIVFSIRQTGNYRLTTRHELQNLLEEAGASDIRISDAYVGSLLAVACWR